jgi:Protein of unknown function (DUF3179)
VWKRTVDGKVLHFYLAGINNQNFLMRDKETGSWWQQISGKAIFGPMRGAALDAVLSDELTFGEWKAEVSDGKVLAPVVKYAKEYDSKWEPEVAKLPVVISFPGTALKSRDVVVGLEMDGASRAYPWELLAKESPVVDHVHGTPLLAVIGPDGKSFRVFVSRIDGQEAEFFLKGGPETDAAAKQEKAGVVQGGSQGGGSQSGAAKAASAKSSDDKSAITGTNADASSAAATAPSAVDKTWLLIDTTTASEWNFQGCAVSGPAQGKCLEQVYALKDYWFDWRNYHPDTTIYKR